MTDDRLREMLHTALPPVGDEGPARDLWPVLGSDGSRQPRWSVIDLGLAVAATGALLFFLDRLWLLVYHF